MNRAQLKELVKNIMSEESEYQAFFQKALDKAGKSIPSMSDDEKKAFFNKIDSAWDGKGEKNEALVGGQKKLDVDGDGEIEASDLADLRAGKKADEGMELPKATIPSTVKSKLDMAIDKIKDSDLTYNQKVQVVGQVMDSLGIDKAEFNKMASKLKGTMESVNESRESDILAQIEKLRVAANSGKITGAQFQNKFYPLWKELKAMNKQNEVVNEAVDVKAGGYRLVSKPDEGVKLYYGGKVIATGFYDMDDWYFWMKHSNWKGSDKGFNNPKEIINYFRAKKITTESVNEGVSSTDMDKIKGAVEAANSFMSVGAELKKLGMKYTFATEPLPIYIIQPTPNNKVAIVNKKYASKPDFVVGDIAVGIMESKSPKSVNEGRAFINAARKAKNEGLTEFEFNGKKYPVTIKD